MNVQLRRDFSVFRQFSLDSLQIAKTVVYFEVEFQRRCAYGMP